MFAAADALDSIGMRYFLSSGTALGVWRDNGLIEGDKDIDLGVLVEDYDSNLNAAMAAQDFRNVVEVGSLADGYKQVFRHVRYDVPVEFCVYYSDGERLWFPVYSRLCGCMRRGYCRLIFSRFQLASVDFLGRSFLIPDPPERYFTENYGEDWRTPKAMTFRQGILGGFKNLVIEIAFLNVLKMLFYLALNRTAGGKPRRAPRFKAG